MLIPRGSYAQLPESEAAAEGRRPLPAGDGGRRSDRLLASLLRAERAQGRPKVRSGLSARPVRASGKEDENGRSQVVCVWGWWWALGWPSADSGGREPLGVSKASAWSMGEG